MFLTRKQLRNMTGFKSYASQRRWLADNGYSFDVRSDGRPNVLHQQVIERQCKGVEARPKSTPNLDALNRFQ